MNRKPVLFGLFLLIVIGFMGVLQAESSFCLGMVQTSWNSWNETTGFKVNQFTDIHRIDSSINSTFLTIYHVEQDNASSAETNLILPGPFNSGESFSYDVIYNGGSGNHASQPLINGNYPPTQLEHCNYTTAGCGVIGYWKDYPDLGNQLGVYHIKYEFYQDQVKMTVIRPDNVTITNTFTGNSAPYTLAINTHTGNDGTINIDYKNFVICFGNIGTYTGIWQETFGINSSSGLPEEGSIGSQLNLRGDYWNLTGLVSKCPWNRIEFCGLNSYPIGYWINGFNGEGIYHLLFQNGTLDINGSIYPNINATLYLFLDNNSIIIEANTTNTSGGNYQIEAFMNGMESYNDSFGRNGTINSINLSVQKIPEVIINLTSWPYEGDLMFYNYFGDSVGPIPFQYNFTNNSDIESCSLLIDSQVVASSKDYYGFNDFSNWNYTKIDAISSEGYHTWQVQCNMTNGFSNSSEIRNFKAQDLVLTPYVYLTWPNDNQIFNWNQTIYPNWDFYNSSNIVSCTQFIDGREIWLYNYYSGNWTQINDPSTGQGPHVWKYSCTNIYGRTSYSENRTFYRLSKDIIPSDLFLVFGNSSSPDFSTPISGLYVGSEEIGNPGSIQFLGNVSFNPNTNLTNLINISPNRIFIDSATLPWLNQPATLTLNGLTFTNPQILRDGVVVNIPYSYANGTLTFNVTGFSTYSAQETPGASSVPSSSSGGNGGGSGGGGGATTPITLNTAKNNTNNITESPGIIPTSNSTNQTTNMKTNQNAPITGGVIGIIKSPLGIGIIILFVLGIGIIIFLSSKRKVKIKNKNE